MTTAEQFKAMCDAATAERNDPLSAVDSVYMTETSLNAFGWSFGIANLRQAAEEMLTEWHRESDMHFGVTIVSYTKDGFRIELGGM